MYSFKILKTGHALHYKFQSIVPSVLLFVRLSFCVCVLRPYHTHTQKRQPSRGHQVTIEKEEKKNGNAKIVLWYNRLCKKMIIYEYD